MKQNESFEDIDMDKNHHLKRLLAIKERRKTKMGTPSRPTTEREEEIRDEYLKTLLDLTFNSKPLIDVLTEVAEEEKAYASTIVDCIVEQLEKVADPLKLPILYLIDSIIKRVRDEYLDLFCKNIARLFTKVYKQEDETVRQKLLKLRFTWNNLLPASVLSQLDKMVQTINPNWPAAPSVHVNPKFVAISTNVTNANGVTTTRIAPVSSELINAVKRVRDPRLRKIELQELPKPAPPVNTISTNNSSSSVIKEARVPPVSPASVPQVDATTKVDQKNDRRLLLEKKQITASKVAVKEPAKKRVAVKVVGMSEKPRISANSNSTVATTNAAAVVNVDKEKLAKAAELSKSKNSSRPAETKSSSSKENPKNIGDMLKDLLKRNEQEGSKERRMERQKLSKEQRNKGLQAIAEELIDNPEGDNILATMAEMYPKIVPILISIMEKCKSDYSSDEKKPSTVKKSANRASSAGKSSSVPKRDKNTSPKSSSKASSATGAQTAPKVSSVSVPISTSQIPLPPTTTSVFAVSSVPSPISATTIPEVETIPAAIASIPMPTSVPIVTTVPSTVLQSTSITSLADKLIPTTLQSISVTTSVTSCTSPAASSPITTVLSPVSVASAPSPVLPIPPPAPIISSTAAAAEQTKTQDVDYRQIFGFQILPVPATATVPMVAEDESKTVIEVRSEDEEIIDVDALPSIPTPPATVTITPPPAKPAQKRKSDSKKHRRNHMKKRRTSSSSNESDASKCSQESITNKRPISEVVKIVDEESSRSPKLDSKRVKPNDSFYSQITAEITPINDEKPQASNLIIMSVSESSRPKSNSPPMFAKFESKFSAGFPANNEPVQPYNTQELPPTDMNLVDMIDDDPVRSINIDGVSREIRHYGSTAIVFMNWDDPRDISFFNGVRNVIIDDKFGIPCTLNAPEVETLVYGVKHRFRLGVPTRELYVNGVGYECYFGGPPIRIRLNYKTNYIKLEGPPPSVNIGSVKRLDMVAGRIHIIIDDQYKHPVYLDAKPQYFLIDKKPVTLMFINGLKGVLINNVQFRTDFGGPSQSFKIMSKVYQFRFTVLPHGVLPGINLSQMMALKLPSPPPLPPQFQFSGTYGLYSQLIPNISQLNYPNTVTDNLPTPPMPPAALTTAIVPSAMDLDPTPVITAPAPSTGVGNILENISIDELFQKLVASGIVPNVENKSEESSDVIKHVDFKKTETLKQRQPGLIKMLYSGIQCGSCGLRFPAEQTLKYSQHLDWHFRLNRKGKDGARTIHSRKWYYSRNDWIKFQEMEDNTDRGTSWFDNHPVTEYTEEVLEDVPCIPAGSNQNAACELCRDRFEQFYNDESDEWQLRNAVKVDDQIYHPTCYGDHQRKLEQEKAEAVVEETPVEETATEAAPEEPAEEKPESVVEPPVMDYDDDSDIEEVQLIEQPIEEIIINDENDFDEPNLETLNTEEIIAAQQEIEDAELPEDVPKPIKIEEPEDDNRIVDISDGGLEPSYDECVETVVDSPQTKSGHEGVVNMDGNIELMDSPAQMISGSTKIKINISKNIAEDKAHSPRNEETKNTTSESSSKDVAENMYPIVSSSTDEETLVPVEIKSRIKDAKLNVYPAVTKGTEKSGLCTIM